MHSISLTLLAAGLLAISPAHATNTPNQQQIQAAVDAGVAKSRATLPIAMRVTSVLGCQPSPEVAEEVVCLVGMSAAMRDGYLVLPLRQDGAEWIGVERKNAQYPGPTPAEAQALIRAWATDLAAADPQAAKDEQIQQAMTTLQVKAVENCEVIRKSGILHCEATLSLPGKPDIKTDFKFALDGKGWRYVPR